MSLSDLSREVRDLIYRALLCPPGGVRLHIDDKLRMKRNKKAAQAFGYTICEKSEGREKGEGEGEDEDEDWVEKRDGDNGEDGEDEEDEEDEASEEDEEEKEDEEEFPDSFRWGNSNSDASAVTPIPTAIFYVSRQIRQDATEVFCDFNRFTFNLDPRAAFKFLKGLRPSSRQRIKDIGFESWFTFSVIPDRFQFNQHYMSRVAAFVTGHMQVRSVTIQAPQCRRHRLVKTNLPLLVDQREWHWSEVASLLTVSLLAGKTQKLRIGHLAELNLKSLEQCEKYPSVPPAQSEDLFPARLHMNSEWVCETKYPRKVYAISYSAISHFATWRSSKLPLAPALPVFYTTILSSHSPYPSAPSQHSFEKSSRASSPSTSSPIPATDESHSPILASALEMSRARQRRTLGHVWILVTQDRVLNESTLERKKCRLFSCARTRRSAERRKPVKEQSGTKGQIDSTATMGRPVSAADQIATQLGAPDRAHWQNRA